MIDEKRLLGLIIDARREAADLGLAVRPSGDPAYELGRLIGFRQGLVKAEQLLIEVTNEGEQEL